MVLVLDFIVVEFVGKFESIIVLVLIFILLFM